MTDTRSDITKAVFNKVPAVTLAFWIVKILATTVGETAAGVLSTTFNLGLVVTSYVMAALLIIAASAADLLTQAPTDGGLGFSRLPTTGVILVIAALLVGYLTAQERKHPAVAIDAANLDDRVAG